MRQRRGWQRDQGGYEVAYLHEYALPADRWARDVLHCPYCHGHEVRDRQLGVLGGNADAVRYAQIVRQWTHDLVYFTPPDILTATERTQLLEPGRTYEYTVRIWPTSNLFAAGHRIRLEVSSSNFPHYDRTPNTGRPFGTDRETVPADQTVYHDAAHPSVLTLPVMPELVQRAQTNRAAVRAYARFAVEHLSGQVCAEGMSPA